MASSVPVRHFGLDSVLPDLGNEVQSRCSLKLTVCGFHPCTSVVLTAFAMLWWLTLSLLANMGASAPNSVWHSDLTPLSCLALPTSSSYKCFGALVSDVILQV